MASEHLTAESPVLEFGGLKRRPDAWIHANLDHATMLGADDKLVEPLLEHGNRVFVFGHRQFLSETDKLCSDLPWPTVHAVAVLFGRLAHIILARQPHAEDSWVDMVVVRETGSNKSYLRANMMTATEGASAEMLAAPQISSSATPQDLDRFPGDR